MGNVRFPLPLLYMQAVKNKYAENALRKGDQLFPSLVNARVANLPPLTGLFSEKEWRSQNKD